jgi:hypothetical protein
MKAGWSVEVIRGRTSRIGDRAKWFLELKSFGVFELGSVALEGVMSDCGDSRVDFLC